MQELELIHDYIDGTLDGEREREMFYALAGSDELRSEFKQFLALKTAIKSDAKAFTPPADSTMKVFGALGFTAAGAGVTAGIGAAFAGFFRKYAQGAISAVAAAAITSIIFIFLSSENGSTSAERRQASLSRSSVETADAKPAKSQIPPPGVPVSSASAEQPENAPAPKIQYKTIVKYVFVDVDSMKKESAADIASDVKLASADKPKKRSLSTFDAPETDLRLSRENMRPARSLSQVSLPATIDAPTSFNISGAEKGESSWRVRLTSEQPFIDSELRPGNAQFLNNTGVALSYCFSDEFSFGLAYRRENFHQVFRGYDESNRLFEYEQQPNFESFGAYGQYSPKALAIGSVSPFVALEIGGAKPGYILRYSVGAEYRPYDEISFYLETQRSSLFYFHKENWFESSKIGLNFGVGFYFK